MQSKFPYYRISNPSKQEDEFPYLDNYSIEFSKEPIDTVDLKTLVSFAKKRLVGRYMVPCLEKYRKLRLIDNLNLRDINPAQLFRGISPIISFGHTVLPRKSDIISEEPVKNILDFIYNNRFDKSVTQDDIKITFAEYYADVYPANSNKTGIES